MISRRAHGRRARLLSRGALQALVMTLLGADPGGAASGPDRRLHSVVYSADEVYRLRGFAGYQIDLEFEAGENFVGLGAGDVEALSFVAQSNHLFIKPRAISVRTNLTVLTTRRSYHFDYIAGASRPDPDHLDVVYVLRFLYPAAAAPAPVAMTTPDAALTQASTRRERNEDYWYCGSAVLQPLSAWDDGVHIHLRFNSRAELPALFVRNDDGSESLLNFSVERDEIVIHRIARQIVLRRGALTGCIVDRSFEGSGAALDSGTLAPDVQRATREAHDEAIH